MASYLALLDSLKLAVGQLREVFREHGVADFAEIGMAARHALGDDEQATDLAFHLDSRIDHLLVDEFQDTSRGQLDLICRLTANWTPGDGRTLFLVGDPMQSIYRFRKLRSASLGDARTRHRSLAAQSIELDLELSFASGPRRPREHNL